MVKNQTREYIAPKVFALEIEGRIMSGSDSEFDGGLPGAGWGDVI